MGHSTIQMIFDTYGQLFPAADDDRVAMSQLQARRLSAGFEERDQGLARTIVRAVLLAAVLGGCAGEPGNKITTQEYEITPLPKDYKIIVTDYLKNRRKDRGAIQVGNAYQSCRVNENDRYYGWAVPVTYGANNRRARGAAPAEIVWFNNNSVQMISSGKMEYCSKA